MPLPPRPTGFSRIHHTPLIQWLAKLDGAAPPPPQDLAQAAAPWLGWTHAIALSTALNAPASAWAKPPASPGRAKTSATAAAASVAELARLRDARMRAIGTEPAFDCPQLADAADLVALRGHVRLHQRAMAAAVAPLRGRLRQALALQGPAGAELAALDAVLETAFAAQETRLLATLPGLLARAGVQPGADPAQAGQQTRRLLLAELTHRLRPLEGLQTALAPVPVGQP